MKRFRVFYYAGLLLLAGCAWISPKQETPVESSKYVQLGKIIHPDRIKNGGKLVIVPFGAGAGVESNEVLDKIALRVVKGVSDHLQEGQLKFELLMADQAREAEFVIEGRVSHLQKSGMWERWFLRKKELQLGVSGRMTERSSGDIILVFNFKRESEQKGEDFQHLGYVLGKDIAGLLLSVNQSN